MWSQHTLQKKDTPALLSRKQLLTPGPLPKNITAQVLEDIVNDICSPGAAYCFLMSREGLTITVLNPENPVPKIHYLNLLMQSVNLTHINIKKDFLDLYIEKNKTAFKCLSLDSLDTIDALFAERKLPPLDNKNITTAHRYAVYHYTDSALNHHFNDFLRGDLEYFHQVSDEHEEDSPYYQALAFYTFSTILIVSDYLSKSPLETEKKLHKITTEKGYRIEIHDKKAINTTVLDGVLKAEESKTNAFIINQSYFTSISMKHLNLAIDNIPLIESTKDKVVAIEFDDEYKRKIDLLSKYPEETEILLPPTDVLYTVLLKTGSFYILNAKTITPLSTESQNTYILKHALRHVWGIVKQEFKDSKRGDLDHQLKLFSVLPVIQRPNHGLAHATRQCALVTDSLDYCIQHGIEKIQLECSILKLNQNAILLIQIAALFLSAGRENEKSQDEDPEGYKKARLTARNLFEKYIQLYYKNSLIEDEDLIKIYSMCLDVIQNLGLPEYLDNLGRQYNKTQSIDDLRHLIIFHLLTTAHLLETPRCLPLEIGKNILNQRLFAKVGGIIKSNDESKEALKNLWKKSLDQMIASGDRIIEQNEYQHIFQEASTSPAFCEEKILFTKQKDKIITLAPTKQSAKTSAICEDSAFNLLYYLYRRSKGPKQQLLSIFENPLSHSLLELSYQFILKNNFDPSEKKEIHLFVHFMKNTALDIIKKQLDRGTITKNDFDNMDLFYQKKCKLTPDEEYINYELLESAETGKFFYESLELKGPFNLDRFKETSDVSNLGTYVKERILMKICQKTQKDPIKEMLKDNYKLIIQWASIHSPFSPNELSLVAEYLNKLLYYKDDQYNKMKYRVNSYHLAILNSIRELLNIVPSPFLQRHKIIQNHKIILVHNENPQIKTTDKIVETVLKEEKDTSDNPIVLYNPEGSKWYACGYGVNGDLRKRRIETPQGNIYPSFEKTFLQFICYLANIEGDNYSALYYLGVCYQEGIGTERDEALAEALFKQLEALLDTPKVKLPPSSEILRYDFKHNTHSYYINTNQNLSAMELKILGLVLASFPHVNNHDWPKAFAEFKSNGIPKKILLLAANAYDFYGNTMLGVAAENGNHVKAVQRLIDMGADINLPDDNRHAPPLYWAINNKLSYDNRKSLEAAKVVKCLLDNGAKTDLIYQDKTLLAYAEEKGYEAAAHLLGKEATDFRKQQNVLIFGLFGQGQSSFKAWSTNNIFDKNTVKMVSDFLRPTLT
jgi:hypothetical protein